MRVGVKREAAGLFENVDSSAAVCPRFGLFCLWRADSVVVRWVREAGGVGAHAQTTLNPCSCAVARVATWKATATTNNQLVHTGQPRLVTYPVVLQPTIAISSISPVVASCHAQTTSGFGC